VEVNFHPNFTKIYIMALNKNSFLYQAHCEQGSPSSKRFWGGIGYGTF